MWKMQPIWQDNDNFDEVLHFFADKDDDTEAAMKRPAKRRRMWACSRTKGFLVEQRLIGLSQ